MYVHIFLGRMNRYVCMYVCMYIYIMLLMYLQTNVNNKMMHFWTYVRIYVLYEWLITFIARSERTFLASVEWFLGIFVCSWAVFCLTLFQILVAPVLSLSMLRLLLIWLKTFPNIVAEVAYEITNGHDDQYAYINDIWYLKVYLIGLSRRVV